ncbi:MAG: hypothetical protein ACD_20C00358G0003 [uncultured bacterium]|nr:MAG: hypothetical protein ACD_20C00358G0003 [uncultured bacterium]HBH19301.1 deoxyribonuclease V [Cyanobacteria bacterium UBA9579]
MIISPKEAIKLQKELADKIIEQNMFEKIDYIAGVDVSQPAFMQQGILYAAVCILSFPELELVEQVHHFQETDFPYIPGLLAFREAPVIINALEKVKTKPDIIIADGHGISHPRKLGIASHIGVLTGHITIGCAKSILVGKPEKELPPKKGSYVPLIYHNKIIGNVLRTKDKVNPVYVSIGNKITLDKATEIVLACTTKYRLPEPTRLAHQYANYARKNNLKS